MVKWPTLLLLASLAVTVGPAAAGPTPAFFDASHAEVDAATVLPAAAYAEVSFAGLDAAAIGDQFSVYEAIETGGNAAADPHPMIPLPPAMWAGLVTLAGVATHTLRQQRGGRAGR